jgi:hypothetical protein
MTKTAEAMQIDIDLVQSIYEAYEIPKEAQDHIWATMAEFCLHQLAHRRGPFYDAAKSEGFLVDILRSPDAPPPVKKRTPRRRAR